jgi:hypothetical protein
MNNRRMNINAVLSKLTIRNRAFKSIESSSDLIFARADENSNNINCEQIIASKQQCVPNFSIPRNLAYRGKGVDRRVPFDIYGLGSGATAGSPHTTNLEVLNNENTATLHDKIGT